jgi:hypothetical protein
MWTVALSSAPTMIPVLIGILLNHSRLSDLRSYMEGRFGALEARFAEIGRRFGETNRRIEELDKKMDQRFDDMKSTWRSELHRVEEVLDARLKHFEER